jgi:hypothetical protein
VELLLNALVSLVVAGSFEKRSARERKVVGNLWGGLEKLKTSTVWRKRKDTSSRWRMVRRAAGRLHRRDRFSEASSRKMAFLLYLKNSLPAGTFSGTCVLFSL